MHFPKLLKLLEVYIDDFTGIIQGLLHQDLLCFTHAVLRGIHTIFPPPTSGTHDNEPIALKKLMQGDGLWTMSKEIGWMFDGLSCCIALPPTKVIKL